MHCHEQLLHLARAVHGAEEMNRAFGHATEELAFLFLVSRAVMPVARVTLYCAFAVSACTATEELCCSIYYLGIWARICVCVFVCLSKMLWS